MEASIQIQNLVKSYDSQIALREVSLEVEPGELFGVIGPDGAGKTTLFRILTTLLVPNSGSARVCGMDVVTDYRKIRTLLGYMPGRFSLYQDLSVMENLQFFASVFNTRIEDNMDLINDIWVQIAPFKDRLAGKLSGGMKQKLALCCALIHQPKVLILDEPTTGVDAVSRREFWDMLKGLKKRGITIVVATPYMDEAVLCERVALMQNGELLQVDTPAGIISGFERELYAVSASDIYKLLLDLRQYPFAESVFPFGQTLHYTDRRATFPTEEMLQYLEELGNQNLSIEKIIPGIEDCFMALGGQQEDTMNSGGKQ
ncbi:MAG: ABC transporter ATP-binding protein [Marinifilaceae bacterium]